MMRQKVYRTARLELRPIALRDWAAWSEAWAKAGPAENEWDISPIPAHRRTRSRFRRSLESQRRRFRAREVYMWTMFRRTDGAFVGWIDISTICREPYQMANFGWFVMNHERRQGYAREACLKLISAAFSDLGFHRLEAAIHPRNRASIRVARSLGFLSEGIKRFYLPNDGVGSSASASGWADYATYITTPELFYSADL